MNKVFDVLDIPRCARPYLSGIEAKPTAVEIRRRMQSSAFTSYTPAWPRVGEFVRRPVMDVEIELWWKDPILTELGKCLNGALPPITKWYGFKLDPRPILGLRFKPCVKGIAFSDRGCEAFVFNPRKGQRIDEYHARFLARAAYEEHCINDPNDPSISILDLSALTKKGPRKPIIHRMAISDMISIERFEKTVNIFMEAVVLAGYDIQFNMGEFTSDLFRKQL